VHDSLTLRAERVDRDRELLAVSLERLDLLAGELVGDQPGGGCPVGGDVVVRRCDRAVWAPDLAAFQPQAVEGLW
jgi:hypothetical protein